MIKKKKERRDVGGGGGGGEGVEELNLNCLYGVSSRKPFHETNVLKRN